MLTEFSCSNIRSIREKVTLSLKAGSDDSFESSLIPFDNERVFPALAIYGSNATGKTSVLTGLALMQSIVNTSHVVQRGDFLPRSPHRLWQNKPTEYSIEFVQKSVRYIYSFIYDNTQIIEESLSYAPNGRIGKIFERKGMNVKAGVNFSKIESLCREKLIQNKLVLSLAANNINYPEVTDAFMFFKDSLVVLMNSNNNWLEYSAATLEHDKAIKEVFLNFMKGTGSDIKDIKTKTETRYLSPAEIPPDLPQEIKAMLLNKPSLFTSIKTVYKDFSLDISEESMGTQKLIRLMCPVMDIFKKGKTFVCDEIESHLHPLIVRQLISRFMKKNLNGAQIICATHDIEMLDLNLFRRDQIYFTDINPDGHRTKLYPLSSLQCRKDDNIQRKYLESKYCKVPKNFWDD